MQCGHTQMAGFSKGQRVIHGFAVADFANQNHVRRLAQGVFQRCKPVFGVHAHFALGDDAVFMRVHKLNRVFNGDDVAVAVLIAVVNQRRQRRGFTRAGAAHKNHQTAFAHHHIFEHGGQIQVFKLRNIAGNHPAHQRHRTALHHGIDTETRHPGQADGEIAFIGVVKLFGLFVVHNRARHHCGVFGGKLFFAHRRQLAVELHCRRKAGSHK